MSQLIKLGKTVAIDIASKSFYDDGLRLWCSGEPGAGKSNTNMLVASQWVDAGRQLIALDAHGEYGELWALRPASMVRIGYDEAPVKEESVEWVMSFVREGKSVLIDLKHWTDIDARPLDKFIRALMVELYRFARERPAQRLVLLEEAQNFIPQQQSKDQYDNVKSFIAMLTGGRKFGLHFVLSSQRASLVDTNAIAQCNVRIFHRISEESDWQRIKKYLPKKFPADFGSKTKRDISLLSAGEAIVVSRWFDTQRMQLPQPRVKVTKFLHGDAA